jgi:hypothetical protein
MKRFAVKFALSKRPEDGLKSKLQQGIVKTSGTGELDVTLYPKYTFIQ